MSSAAEIEPGNVLLLEGAAWRVLEVRRAVAGAHQGHVQTVVRCVASGARERRRFREGERVVFAPVRRREAQYLYAADGLHHLMDLTSFEQTALDGDVLGDAAGYLREGDTVETEVLDGRTIGVVLPERVRLAVAETAPAGPDDDVPETRKPAVLETGLRIGVPLTVGPGDRIVVDTRTGRFVERVP